MVQNIESGAHLLLLSETKMNWQRQIDKLKYCKYFILFFPLRIDEFYKVFRFDADISETMIDCEPILRYANALWPDRKKYGFEESAKIMVDNANQLIERYYKPVLVKTGALMGETDLDNKMIGQLYINLRKHELVNLVVPFIVDDDILLARNAASHNGAIIDISTEKIKLQKKGKLKKECTLNELGDILRRATQIRADFENAGFALNFMIEKLFSFTMGNILFEISKVNDTTTIKLRTMNKGGLER